MTGVRILVAEDEPIVARDIQVALENRGYDVPSVASSGEEAIEKTQKMQPNLVLMDIILSGDVDGIKAAEQIRDRFDVPVLYLTSYADQQTVERAKLTSPFAYITKPFEERELLANIETALYKHKMEKALRASEQQLRAANQQLKASEQQLKAANQQLQADITEREQIRKRLLEYQKQLSSLGSQLSLAEERERKRIAQGLHDDIIQPLVFLDVKLKSLGESDVSRQLSDSFHEMRAVIAKLIQDARSFTFDLSYPVLYELGLEAATKQWLVTEVQEKHGLKTAFRDDGRSKPLTSDMRAFLFKAVKELLVNVVKHAKADSVEVSIGMQRDDIVISVKDDGVGFPVREKTEHFADLKGFGLFSIRDRLTYLGGRIDIESELGRGTRVVIVMPLEDER